MDRLPPKRKLKREVRRRRHQSAWIAFDGEATARECRVSDVSQNGAKIVVDVGTEIGTRFGLALVPNHPKRQRCEVVWRRGRTIGIKFVS
jgi:PilZ domain